MSDFHFLGFLAVKITSGMERVAEGDERQGHDRKFGVCHDCIDGWDAGFLGLFCGLSDRELGVSRLLGDGWGNAMMGAHLEILAASFSGVSDCLGIPEFSAVNLELSEILPRIGAAFASDPVARGIRIEAAG